MSLLATLSDLTTATGRTAGDPLAAVALRRASHRFAGAVGWPIVQRSATVTLYGDCGRWLQLPGMNIRDVSAKLDGKPVENLAVDGRLGLIRRDDGWPDGKPVEVTFTSGWAEDDIPGDIQDVVLEQAASLLTIMEHRGATRVTRGPFSLEWSATGQPGVTAAWTEAVRRYKVGVGDWS